MILKWLFGPAAPVVFDLNQIPGGDSKYTLSDAKRHLKEHLVEIGYGGSEDIRYQLAEFSDYVSCFKESIKDEVGSSKEDLEDQKASLREAKAELANFKRSKKSFLKDGSIDDFDYELFEYQEVVKEHMGYVAESEAHLEVTRSIGEKLAPATKILLPRFIEALKNDREPSYHHYDPPIRICIQFESQRSSVPEPTITEREVDVQDLTSVGFSGHCHLRNDRRNFSFAGVLAYRYEGNVEPGVSLFDFLLNKLGWRQ